MRRVVVLAVVALALSAFAVADDIIITNQYGTVAISGMPGTSGMGTIGVSTITSKGSQLTSWNDITGHLGQVNYATGALASGSIENGGTFAAGGYFDILGVGKWAKQLTHCSPCQNPIPLFTGSFDSTVDWTQTGKTKSGATYALTGDIQGTLWSGRLVNGSVVENIAILNKGQLNQGVGHINMSGGTIVTPEPGTLGLLGTGLVAVAGLFRRKLSKG